MEKTASEVSNELRAATAELVAAAARFSLLASQEFGRAYPDDYAKIAAAVIGGAGGLETRIVIAPRPAIELALEIDGERAVFFEAPAKCADLPAIASALGRIHPALAEGLSK